MSTFQHQGNLDLSYVLLEFERRAPRYEISGDSGIQNLADRVMISLVLVNIDTSKQKGLRGPCFDLCPQFSSTSIRIIQHTRIQANSIHSAGSFLSTIVLIELLL